MTQGFSKENLMTGLQSGQYVLRDFEGVVDDFDPISRGEGSNSYIHVVFKFKDVVVAAGGSTIPYQLTTGEIGVNYNEKMNPKSAWGYWCNSINQVFGVPSHPGVPVSSIVGKKVHVKWVGGHSGSRQDAAGAWQERTDIEGYEIISIDGVGAGGTASTPPLPSASTPDTTASAENPLLFLAALADGKDAAGFNSNALIHPTVQGNSTLLNDVITNGPGLLAGMVASSMLTLDENGVYHRVLNA